jgi:murein DD-endopeptidase MepM/ murein hydrolase activator NlpD
MRRLQKTAKRFVFTTAITLILAVIGFQTAFGTTHTRLPGLPAAIAAAKPPTKTCPTGCVSGSGWVRPVNAPVWGGFRANNPSNPQHDGVDLGAQRDSPIRAASAGTIVTVLCDITPASWGCNRDGSAQTPGCGWYVDIRHAGSVYTRYCHMIRQPSVHVGQIVTAGQIIGYVGSSGHSGSTHLHFEVHLGDQSRNTAVDPIPFMIKHGAPLGTT